MAVLQLSILPRQATRSHGHFRRIERGVDHAIAKQVRTLAQIKQKLENGTLWHARPLAKSREFAVNVSFNFVKKNQR